MLTCKAHSMVFITCTYGLLNSGTDLPTVISIVETLSVDNIYITTGYNLQRYIIVCTYLPPIFVSTFMPLFSKRSF